MSGQKRKGASRLSRRKKKYWRSGAQVDAIEDALYAEREDERLGGSAKSKSDSQLFFIQKITGDDEKAAQQTKSFHLKSLANLAPDDRILPAQSSVTRKTKGSKFKNEIRPSTQNNKALPDPNAQDGAVYDLWANDTPVEKSQRLPNISVLHEDVVDYTLRQLRKKPVKIPKTYHKKFSLLPNVEVCHPGASYNPSFGDHQELLCAANEIEKIKVKKVEKLERQTAIPRNLDPVSALSEISEGLDTGDGLASDEEVNLIQDQEEYSTPAPPVVVKRKLKAQRLRELQSKKLHKRIHSEKQKRQTEHDIYRIRGLTREIKAAERQAAATAQRTQERKQARLAKPGRHTNVKVQEVDPEILLSSELPGCLRLLKPEGSILEERFRSWQKRNIIETRVRQKRKRIYKPKKFETHGYKEVTVSSKPI